MPAGQHQRDFNQYQVTCRDVSGQAEITVEIFDTNINDFVLLACTTDSSPLPAGRMGAGIFTANNAARGTMDELETVSVA